MMASSPPGSPTHVSIATSPLPSPSPASPKAFSSSTKPPMSPPTSPAQPKTALGAPPLWEQYILATDLPSDLDNDDDEYSPDQDEDVVEADHAEAYEYLEQLPDDEQDADQAEAGEANTQPELEARWLKLEQWMPARVLADWSRFLHADGGLFVFTMIAYVLVSAVACGLLVAWQSPLTLVSRDGWVQLGRGIWNVRRQALDGVARVVRFGS